MSSELLGAVILYGPIALASAVFWAGVYVLVRDLTARDVMAVFRPKAKDVHHTERLLNVCVPQPKTTWTQLLTQMGNRHD